MIVIISNTLSITAIFNLIYFKFQLFFYLNRFLNLNKGPLKTKADDCIVPD